MGRTAKPAGVFVEGDRVIEERDGLGANAEHRRIAGHASNTAPKTTGHAASRTGMFRRTSDAAIETRPPATRPSPTGLFVERPDS